MLLFSGQAHKRVGYARLIPGPVAYTNLPGKSVSVRTIKPLGLGLTIDPLGLGLGLTIDPLALGLTIPVDPLGLGLTIADPLALGLGLMIDPLALRLE